jgi:hypothetical protein
METQVKDLSLTEFKKLISETVRKSMEEYLEDIICLNNPQYIQSIKEAREDYKKGDYKSFEDIFHV